MKRIVQLLLSALVLTISALPASSVNITASLSRALADAVEASRTRPGPSPLRGADYAISTFNEGVVAAFAVAWRHSGNGTTGLEGVVLVLRMADGSFSGKEMGATNEQKKFTFRWHPATIAIVHTHPNQSDPRPHDDDLTVADKYQVPIFTITRTGMYVYDPLTRRISQVLNNLDWLEASKFSKVMVAGE